MLHLLAPSLNNPAAAFFIGTGLMIILFMTICHVLGGFVAEWRFRRSTRLYLAQQQRADQQLQNQIHQLVNTQAAILPSDFFALRTAKRLPEFEGVYVLHNATNRKNYVGQSIHVIDRVNQHFTGHGSADVYVDYRQGQQFQISLIPLTNSGFPSLNALEKNVIRTYHAYSRGYNKTRGNGG